MAIIHHGLEEAISYAALGWKLLPIAGIVDGKCTCRASVHCPSPGKHPLLMDWPSEATCDLDTLKKWFAIFPSMNIGISLGEPSNVVDIEFDTEEGELTAARLLNKTRTPTYYSARSTHRLYRLCDDILSDTSCVIMVAGLEIRGVGDAACQSLLPPSRHVSGKHYEWLPGLSPLDVAVAEFPQSVLDLIQKIDAGPIASFVMGDNLDLASHPGVSRGGRNSMLCRLVGAWLATHGPGIELLAASLVWGARCTPPLPQDEVVKAVQALEKKHLAKQPRQSAARPGLAVRGYDSIASQSVEWLWRNRIALGKLSVLVGEPGLGKTFCGIDIIAHVTTGRPFCDGATPPVGECAIATAEDDAADTLRPRLDAAGADPAKVFHIDGAHVEGGEPLYLSLADHLPAIERFLEARPAMKLLLIDPISAFLGGKCDGNNNAEVRNILGPLSKLAERRGVAVLAISHLNKSSEGKSVNRVIGSIAFVAAARVVWRIGQDPDDESRRIFTPVKNNLSKVNGLAYRIVGNRCEWEKGEVFITCDDIDGDNTTPRDEARAWLEAKLSEGPQLAADMFKWARGDGISDRTLKRAKAELDIETKRQGMGWAWRLEQQPKTDTDPRFDEGQGGHDEGVRS